LGGAKWQLTQRRFSIVGTITVEKKLATRIDFHELINWLQRRFTPLGKLLQLVTAHLTAGPKVGGNVIV
jgi:hypothetical protein